MAAKRASAVDLDVMEPAAPVVQEVPQPAVEDDPGARRIAEIRARRQGRDTQDVSGYRMRLSVPEPLKDPRFTYRWVLDRDMRAEQLRNQDWDVVRDEDIAKAGENVGLGMQTERIVNERSVKGGGVEKAILMRKPVEFYEADKKLEQDRIKELEKGLARGDVGSAEGLQGPHSYIPAGGMKIEVK